jgi:hypothetical protein
MEWTIPQLEDYYDGIAKNNEDPEGVTDNGDGTQKVKVKGEDAWQFLMNGNGKL